MSDYNSSKKRYDIYVGPIVGGAYVDKENAKKDWDIAKANLAKNAALILKAQSLLIPLNRVIEKTAETLSMLQGANLLEKITNTINDLRDRQNNLKLEGVTKNRAAIRAIEEYINKLESLWNDAYANDTDNDGFNGGLITAAEQNHNLALDKYETCNKIYNDLVANKTTCEELVTETKETYDTAQEILDSYVDRDEMTDSKAMTNSLSEYERRLNAISKAIDDINTIDAAIIDTYDNVSAEYDELKEASDSLGYITEVVDEDTTIYYNINEDGTKGDIAYIEYDGVNYYKTVQDQPKLESDEIAVRMTYDYDDGTGVVTYNGWKKVYMGEMNITVIKDENGDYYTYLESAPSLPTEPCPSGDDYEWAIASLTTGDGKTYYRIYEKLITNPTEDMYFFVGSLSQAAEYGIVRDIQSFDTLAFNEITNDIKNDHFDTITTWNDITIGWTGSDNVLIIGPSSILPPADQLLVKTSVNDTYRKDLDDLSNEYNLKIDNVDYNVYITANEVTSDTGNLLITQAVG